MIETVTILTDDIDGKTRANVETVRFAIDGAWYEIELGALNRRRIADTLAPYIEHARRPANGVKANGTKPNATANGSRSNRTPVRVRRYSNTEVRAWLRAQGIDVKDRGRIAAELVDRFHAAQQAS